MELRKPSDWPLWLPSSITSPLILLLWALICLALLLVLGKQWSETDSEFRNRALYPLHRLKWPCRKSKPASLKENTYANPKKVHLQSLLLTKEILLSLDLPLMTGGWLCCPFCGLPLIPVLVPASASVVLAPEVLPPPPRLGFLWGPCSEKTSMNLTDKLRSEPCLGLLTREEMSLLSLLSADNCFVIFFCLLNLIYILAKPSSLYCLLTNPLHRQQLCQHRLTSVSEVHRLRWQLKPKYTGQ